jgi:hypothetical protein
MGKSSKVLVITSIELRSPFYYFALSLSGMKIVRQLKTLPCLGWKARGFWTSHYTMTLWESREGIDSFVRTGAHRIAMGKGAKLATEIRTFAMNSETMLPWKEALMRLKTDGRIIRY